MTGNRLNETERKVQSAYIDGKYEEMRKMLEKAGSRIRPVYLAIFNAALAFAAEDTHGAWEAIAEGLRIDGHNYELYMMLGDYYASRNLYQAYLCYENALFYCDEAEDRQQISLVLENLKEQGISVPKTAMVILSYNLLSMTRECIESIRETIPASAREIIVVDNASEDGSVEWLKQQQDIKILCNVENKGFPAGCNQGIRLADSDSDIFLLNNDTVMTDNALFWLRMGLYENEEVGSTGSVSNHVSNFQAVIEDGKSREDYLDFARRVNIPMEKPYLNKVHLVGFALLLKRTVLNQIGLLDERFSPGNWEDNDLCLRLNLAGYRNVLCKNSFIIHWGSKAFGKERQKYGNILEINKRKFFDKWSAFSLEPANCMDIRIGLLSPIEKEHNLTDSLIIMVVGTGCGMLLSCLQDRFPNAQIYGMEQRMYMAQIADRVADTTYVDLDEWKGDEVAESFDFIIIDDALEHTKNPGAVLAELAKMLKKDGRLIFSFVNSQHYSRITRPDRNRGLFSREQASEMLSAAKLAEGGWQYTMVRESSEELDKKLQKVHMQYPMITRDALLADQWITVAEKQKEDIFSVGGCFMGLKEDIRKKKENQDEKLPLVSVLMPCYNHGAYVGQAIESILNQTYPNIELIVADNGCTDNSFEVIRQYQDRIKILRLDKNNRQLCGEMLLEAAMGEYIAYATADDEWESEKIALQMEAFASIPNLQVCFTWGLYADENLQVFPNQENNVFLVRNRSRAEWLKRFIHNGNCLCFPSAVLKKELLSYFDSVNRGYIQLSDFNQWISVIQMGEIYIVEKPMVKFRWHVNGDNHNDSAPSIENTIRTDQEYVEIVLQTIESVKDSFFKEAFESEFVHCSAETHSEILCEKFFLLKRLAEKSYCFSEIMLNFYHNHYFEMEKVLEREYGFSAADFVDLATRNGLPRVCMELDRNMKIVELQREYINAYLRIAQELAGEVYASNFVGDKGRMIFGMMPESERNNLQSLYGACNLVLNNITNNNEADAEQYEQSIGLLAKLCQSMKNMQVYAKLLGIMWDEETFELFCELVHLGEKSRIDLGEAIIPYIQVIAGQLGEILDL